MNNGPLPTRLVFLSDLPAIAPGTKVRFLGCITDYNQATGCLALQHAYPPPPSPCLTAIVDVNILLERLKSTDTRIGEWLNVMGYVEAHPEPLEEKSSHRRGHHNHVKREERKGGKPTARVRVQAVMLWSAGAVRLAEYEKALAARIEVEQSINNNLKIVETY